MVCTHTRIRKLLGGIVWCRECGALKDTLSTRGRWVLPGTRPPGAPGTTRTASARITKVQLALFEPAGGTRP